VYKRQRAGDRLQLTKVFQASLTLDPFTDDPELVGREIRNHLDAASVHGNRCVVSVPPKLALTQQTELPELSGSDTDSFLRIQAEREFPFAPDDLSLSVSRYGVAGGSEYATIVAIPANHLTVLEKALRAANLRPLSVTIGTTSLVDPRIEQGTVAVLVRNDDVDLAIFAGGGVVALRSLEENVAADPEGKAIDPDMVLRQIRITLGQLPQDLRELVHSVKVYGPTDAVEPVLDELRDPLTRMGMSVETGVVDIEVHGAASAAAKRVSPSAIAVAAKRLSEQPCDLEFLPPRTSRFKSVAGRISSRSTLWLAGVTAAIVLGLGAAFFVQHWRLSSLEKEWETIEPIANETEALQQKVRTFRPWFDESPATMVILKKLTEAFPKEGAVWAKTLGIKDLSQTSCSGYAQTNRDWLKMLDTLRDTPGVEDLQVSQVQGGSPVQFTMSFRWNAGESDGS